LEFGGKLFLQVISDDIKISKEDATKWKQYEYVQNQIILIVLTSKSLIKHLDGSKSTSNLFLSSSGRLPFKSLGNKKGWKNLPACPLATCVPVTFPTRISFD